MSQIVYYFEMPTIGYCPNCEAIACWHSRKGLFCPKCRTEELSYFTWDKESRYPE